MTHNQEYFLQLVKELEVSFTVQSPTIGHGACIIVYQRTTIRQLVCTLVSLNGIQSWVMNLLVVHLRNSGKIIL